MEVEQVMQIIEVMQVMLATNLVLFMFWFHLKKAKKLRLGLNF